MQRLASHLPSGLRMFMGALVFAGVGLSLSGCAGFGGAEEAPPPRPVVQQPPIAVQPPPKKTTAEPTARESGGFYMPKQMEGRSLVRVALLLPFNSSRADVRALSNSLYNAAQLALFEFNNPNILLMPKATGGSAIGAQTAATEAVKEGADLIIGPLFAEEVSAVAPVAHGANVPVVAFSTDMTVAGNGVYLLSFLPSADVSRIVDFASLKGINNFAALFPENDYGARVRAAFEKAVADHGAHIATVATYPANGLGMNGPVQQLANYGARHGALLAKRSELKKTNDAQGLKEIEKQDTIGDVSFQAVFLPEGGARLRALAPLLPYYDVDPRKVKFLGTGLWDDPSLQTEPSLEGGWYPAPPPEAHAQFVARYARVYGSTPPRIVSLAYDAVSLAVALSSKPEGERFTAQSLTEPDGFAGVDGIFRFLPDGRTERGLAILEMHGSGPVVVDPAPASFSVPPSL
ncbi:penicillin-binding protein activator [Parvibaculum sp.]|uniref:penicillin-binding protein activator n=1 Tax=Parvibaculum sp. TaxID=2024848 RepID=UPI00320E5D23